MPDTVTSYVMNEPLHFTPYNLDFPTQELCFKWPVYSNPLFP